MTTPPIDQKEYRRVATATFALGCFWGPDARFGVMPGVIRTRVGYTGGTTPNPTYKNIGDHAEAVQVEYDASKLSYEDVLGIFWLAHNPLTASDRGQYRKAVWYHDEGQKAILDESRARLESRKGGPVQTHIGPAGAFTLAEDYHQKWYLRQNGRIMPYFEQLFPGTGRAFTNSTAAARVNGFVKGHGHPFHLQAEVSQYGLPPEGQQALIEEVGEPE
jgi:peptide-methionine (S)-S-oxide reductase